MITIVGAGLVGSLWALLLRRKGYDVEVFERRADIRRASAAAGRSINLIITSRGLYGLEKAGLEKEIYKLAVPVYGRMIHSLTGEQIYQAYGQENECNLSISRDALNRFLIDHAERAGAMFHFEHELQSLDVNGKALKFSTPVGERTAAYDVLFGTDGAGSRVRKALPEARERTDWLEADYKELSIPLDAQGQAQLKTSALHIWPRGDRMLMALANQDGSFTATVYLPKARFAQLKTPAEVEAFFKTEFVDAVPLMENYVSDFMDHAQGALGTVHTTQWTFADSIALMGDAAHAIVPFFGQGMNCGFEDCTTLLELLDEGHGWPATLKNYERMQKPNADAIAEMALENWVEMRDRVGDQKFLLRKKVEGALEAKHPQLYKSRYGLITYTLVPYALAKKAGLVQAKLLDQIIGEATSLEDISWAKAETLLREIWVPFVEHTHLRIQNYP